MRCIRLPSAEDGKCIRCTRSGADCVVPQRQLGRKKGSQKCVVLLLHISADVNASRDQIETPGEALAHDDDDHLVTLRAFR